MIVRTAQWSLHATTVMGPDAVSYGEVGTVGLRLDGVPQRQGFTSMEWRYTAMPLEEYTLIHGLWEQHPEAISVVWFDPYGNWRDGTLHMLEPVIGRRETFYLYDVSIRFVPVAYTGAGLVTAPGDVPDIYEGWQNENKPPVAHISFSASVWGDPIIVVNLDGSGSHDPDSGVISSYTWTDNSAEFQALPDYPFFDPPHEGSGPTATFQYPYQSGMPNPVITLSVSDNAALTGTATITVDIANLMATLPTIGKKILAIADSTALYSANGGLGWTEIPNITGTPVVIGSAAGSVLIGCDDGSVWYGQSPDVLTVRQVYTMSDAVLSIAVSESDPSMVVIFAVDGSWATSGSSGANWTAQTAIEGTFKGASFNGGVANEFGVYGSIVQYTRNFGTSWTVDEAGLPTPVDVNAVTRGLIIRYTAPIQGGLKAATGSAWIDVDLGGAATIVAMSQISNVLISVDSSSTARRIVETTVEATLALPEAGTTYAVAQDPTNVNLVLFGTDNGIYKSLDALATGGQLALAGQVVPSLSFLRDPVAPVGEIVMLSGGGTDTPECWYFHTGTGWLRRQTGLPAGYRLRLVKADVFDRGQWAILLNSPGSIADPAQYEIVNHDSYWRVICLGTQIAPVDPVWITSDAGVSWHPCELRIPKHLGHADCYVTALEFTSARVTAMEWDRVVPGRLYVGGSGHIPSPGGLYSTSMDGILWRGAPSGSILGRITGHQHGTSAWSIITYNKYWSAFDSSPDGGVVGHSFASGGAVFEESDTVGFAEAGTAWNYTRNPGGLLLNGIPRNFEREPAFNARRVLLAYWAAVSTPTSRHVLRLFGSANYSTEAVYAIGEIPVAIGSQEQAIAQFAGTFSWGRFGIWISGMGLRRIEAPFVSVDVAEHYSPSTLFTDVRVDRQWREVVGAYASVDRTFHILDRSGWHTVPLPEDAVSAAFEVIA